MRYKQSRAAGFVIILVVYLLAAAVAIGVFMALPGMHIFLRVLITDIVATLLVYIAGLLVGNASVYDPYWSVAPPVFLTGLCLYYNQFGPGVLLLLAVVWYWAIRLTLNWAVTFHGLDRQDWRYDLFKQRYPRLYPIISLGGIHLVPTLVVYLAMLPAIAFVQAGGALNWLTLLGAALSTLAATLQLVADIQMHRFNREADNRQRLIREGLWTHSRHPNYLGEIIMWWGVYIIMLSALPGEWPLCMGAVANTLLFLCISIPMAEKHNASKREGYEAYRRQTRILLPLPRFTNQ